MTSLTLLALLLIISHSVYGQSSAGNDTCHDKGILGRLDRNTKSSVVAQQSMSESLQSLSVGQQSLLEGQQSMMATLRSILEAQNAKECENVFAGLIQMYGNAGQAVQVSSSDEVVLSADVRGAATFQLVTCLASSTVSAELRPRCVSLADATRTDRYVRHRGHYLHVDAQNETPLFKADSSFILHKDTFYQGTYALQSVNYPDHYIKPDANGHLRITQQDNSADYNDTASFRIHDSSDVRTTAMPSVQPTCSPTGTVSACPYYFTQLPGTNSCYKRESVSANWLDAQESCMSYHNKTHLVVIDNAAEDNAIVSWLSGFEGCSDDYWTAGQRVNLTHETPFVWKAKSVDSYQELSLNYTNWSSGEPNNHQGNANQVHEGCVNLWGHDKLMWNDEPCSNTKCYVCEYDL